MKKRQNNSDRGSALQIAFSIALISISVILLVVAAPTDTKIASRTATATGQSSGMTGRAVLMTASPAATPTTVASAKICAIR
jgi:hypothetical protein